MNYLELTQYHIESTQMHRGIPNDLIWILDIATHGIP